MCGPTPLYVWIYFNTHMSFFKAHHTETATICMTLLLYSISYSLYAGVIYIHIAVCSYTACTHNLHKLLKFQKNVVTAIHGYNGGVWLGRERIMKLVIHAGGYIHNGRWWSSLIIIL